MIQVQTKTLANHIQTDSAAEYTGPFNVFLDRVKKGPDREEVLTEKCFSSR